MRKVWRAAPMVGALVAAAGAHAAGGGGAAGIDGLHLVPLEPITVPIIETGRIGGSLNVSLVLQATDGVAAERLGRDMPRLRAASVAATLEFARLRASPLTPVDAIDLDEELTVALNRVDPGVGKVLIVKVSADRE